MVVIFAITSLEEDLPAEVLRNGLTKMEERPVKRKNPAIAVGFFRELGINSFVKDGFSVGF